MNILNKVIPFESNNVTFGMIESYYTNMFISRFSYFIPNIRARIEIDEKNIYFNMTLYNIEL